MPISRPSPHLKTPVSRSRCWYRWIPAYLPERCARLFRENRLPRTVYGWLVVVACGVVSDERDVIWLTYVHTYNQDWRVQYTQVRTLPPVRQQYIATAHALQRDDLQGSTLCLTRHVELVSSGLWEDEGETNVASGTASRIGGHFEGGACWGRLGGRALFATGCWAVNPDFGHGSTALGVWSKGGPVQCPILRAGILFDAWTTMSRL